MVRTTPPAGKRETKAPSLAPQNAPSSPQFQIDPWILWFTFRRCWLWAVPVGVLLAAAATFYVMQSFVPSYRASHLLEANNDYLVFKDVMPKSRNLASTEPQILMNSVVLDPVLANPLFRSAPSLSNPETADHKLRANLTIKSPGSGMQLVVSYQDTDPDAAAMVCNAVVESYLEKRRTLDSARVKDLAEWLDPEIERWKQEVEDRQRKVHVLSRANLGDSGAIVTMIEDADNMSQLARLRTNITEVKVQLAIIDAKQSMQGLEGRDPQSAQGFQLPEISVEQLEPAEAEIMALVRKEDDVVEAEALVRRYKMTLTSLEDADLVRINRGYYAELQSKRDLWIKKRQAAEVAARQRVSERLSEYAEVQMERRKLAAEKELAAMAAKNRVLAKQAIAAESAARRQERKVLLTKLELLQKEYDAQSETERMRREHFGGIAADLQFAEVELNVATEIWTRLRDRAAAIRTERQHQGGVRTVAPALPPKDPIETFPLKQVVMTSGAAFFVPFLLGLLWEVKVQRLTDTSLVDKNRALAPVVGEVAQLPTGTRANRGRRVFEESVDSLRANLLLSDNTKGIRSIAVTSSMSSEGKSSVASQLAISIAKATGESVLLIDADLRCPDQHDIFGLEMGPGLSAVLSNQVDLDDAIDKSLGDLVHVLPAGRLNQSPHRLLGRTMMDRLVARATEAYKYVVFDTAPVLSAGETLAVSGAVDATLVCVLRDVSRMDNVMRTTRRLEAAGANIVGTVFSGVTAREYAYRYGDYHYAVAAEEVHA